MSTESDIIYANYFKNPRSHYIEGSKHFLEIEWIQFHISPTVLAVNTSCSIWEALGFFCVYCSNKWFCLARLMIWKEKVTLNFIYLNVIFRSRLSSAAFHTTILNEFENKENLCKHASHLVINICDVHTVEDVIFKIILQYSPEYIKRYVGSER